MPSDSLRSIDLVRTSAGTFQASNARGGTLDIASDNSPLFTPVELLLAAIGACTGMDVDAITARRSEPDQFAITVEGHKIRDAGGNRLTDLTVTFNVIFPDGDAGDAARTILPEAVRRSHDRLCTVSRTVELGSPVTTTVQ